MTRTCAVAQKLASLQFTNGVEVGSPEQVARATIRAIPVNGDRVAIAKAVHQVLVCAALYDWGEGACQQFIYTAWSKRNDRACATDRRRRKHIQSVVLKLVLTCLEAERHVRSIDYPSRPTTCLA